MTNENDTFPINEKEVMEYYGYSGTNGRIKLKMKFLRGWILHSMAYSSPLSNFGFFINLHSDQLILHGL